MEPSALFRPTGNPGRRKCILSLDGGGVRGIISSVMLERLESHLQKLEGEDVRIVDYFDGIAGTSTGALIACLLVVPDSETKRPKYTAKDALNFYLRNSADVFPQRSGCFGSIRSLLYRLIGPLYSSKPLTKLLKEIFGNLKLSETFKPVTVPAYDINNQVSIQFSTTQVKSKEIPDCYIRDVLRASTAAPTYLAPYYFTSVAADGVKREFNMVDGGICANNPTFIAVSEYLRDDSGGGEGEAAGYKDVLVLSLGTGKTSVSYTAKRTARWGTLSWIFNKGNVPLLDMLMLASQDVVDYTLSNTFYEQGSHDNYLRIQTDQLDGTQMQLDNSSKENLDSLVDAAHKLLHSKALMRNKLGQFVPDPRWITNDEALFRFASWLVEEKKIRNKLN